LRAGMVEDPSEYHWSSYHRNALGKVNPLIQPGQTHECSKNGI